MSLSCSDAPPTANCTVLVFGTSGSSGISNALTLPGGAMKEFKFGERGFSGLKQVSLNARYGDKTGVGIHSMDYSIVNSC